LSECVHQSRNEYFSERVPQILGSKGLLITNTYYNDILKEDIHYIYVKKSNFVAKIMDILHNYSYYEKIKENGYKLALKNYTWKCWAERFKLYNKLTT
jgi:glycosyltransferase involved in cell wall biosynthesis